MAMVALPEPIVFGNLFSRLPAPIFEDILLRVPVKFLMRLRCASKSWLCFLTGKNFVSLHLKRAPLRTRILFLDNGDLRSIDYNMGDNRFLRLPVEIGLRLSVEIGASTLEMISSCNGLVCLTSFGSHFMYLWNPSTADYKKLPRFPNNFTFSRMHGYGFGYDESSDDYKFVFFYSHCYEDCTRETEVSELRACVYSHKSFSWKIISGMGKLSPDSDSSDDGLLIDGALYWVSKRKLRIFELGCERTEEVELPEFEIRRHNIRLVIRQGRVCCMMYRESLWIMYEYVSNGCWTKLSSSLPNIGFEYNRPLCYTQYDEIIISTKTKLLKVDSGGNTIAERRTFSSDFLPVIYTESLISPRERSLSKGTKRLREENTNKLHYTSSC